MLGGASFGGELKMMFCSIWFVTKTIIFTPKLIRTWSPPATPKYSQWTLLWYFWWVHLLYSYKYLIYTYIFDMIVFNNTYFLCNNNNKWNCNNFSPAKNFNDYICIRTYIHMLEVNYTSMYTQTYVHSRTYICSHVKRKK